MGGGGQTGHSESQFIRRGGRMMMHNQFDSVRFNDYAHNNQGQQFAQSKINR